MTKLFSRIGLSLAALMLISAVPTICSADVVYNWTPGRFHAGGNTSATPVTGPSGQPGLQITTIGGGYNHFIVTSRGLLKGGHDYTAVVSYEVVTSPKFPDSFYVFARSSSLGQANDVWQNFLGEPGKPEKARLTMSLKPANDWTFYVGCKGPSSIIIDSCTITDGTGYVYVPAVARANVKAVASTVVPPLHLPTGAPPVTISAPKPKQTLVLSAKDFGLVADSGTTPASMDVAAANFTAISATFGAAAKRGASVLTIPPGIYRFTSTTAIPMDHLNDLVVNGQGATFVFEKIHPPFAAISVNDCHRCVFKNLKIDWDWSVTPIATLGQVVTASDDHLSADIKLPDDNSAETDLVVKSPWMAMFPIDPVKLLITSDIHLSTSVASITKTGDNTVHVVFKNPVALVAGGFYGIRHLYYDMGAFRMADCSDVLFDNVTIYSIPGMGWFCRGETKNWELHNCRIVRPPGSRRVFTTAADGFHVSESLGGLILDGCEFTGLGDDCMNIHSIVFEGLQRVNDHTLTLLNNPRYRLKVNVGDEIELFNADCSPLGFKSTISAIKYDGQNTVLTLTQALPATVLEQDIIVNHHYHTSDVHIVNCNFHDTGGRGVLYSGENATIENCTFNHTFSCGIQIETEIVGYLWAEGHAASNVVIRNNVFDGENARTRFGGPSIYVGPLLPAGPSSYPMFHDILIAGNSFTDCNGPFVSINSAQNITVRNNRISRLVADAPATLLSGSIFASYASDLNLGGNTWTASPAPVKPGVVDDPDTTSDVQAAGNAIVASAAK